MGSWTRLAPLTGIVAVILIVVSFILGGEPPATDDPIEEIVDFYVDDDDKIMGASALLAIGAVFFTFFFTAVAGRLRRAEANPSALSIGVVAGAAMAAIGLLIFAGIGFTAAEGAEDFEPAALQTLNAMNLNLFFPVAGGTAVLAWMLGLAVLRNGGLPRWLGWFAIVIGVVAVTPAGFVAFGALGLWILIASVVMLMQPEAEAA